MDSIKVRGESALESRTNSATAALRVLFYLFFPGGGIGRYTHELLQQFATGDDVLTELACLPAYHWREAASYPVWPHLRPIGHPVAWRRRLRFLIGQFVSPRRALRYAAQTRADVIHFSSFNHLTFPYWKRMVSSSRPKIVATAHDVRRRVAMINRRFEDRQLQLFYQRADALFVHSRSQAEDLMDFARLDGSRIHIVPHGPYDYGPPTASREVLRTKYGLPQDKVVALSFGLIRDEKNLGHLLQALPRFKESLHLLVAGTGDTTGHKSLEYYRELAQSLGIESAVTFLGRYIPDSEVPDLFEACDWVAMPYSRSFTSQSGVLNVAVSYNRPLLTTRAPTFAETLDGLDVGVMVEPDSVDALTEGIATLHAQIGEGRSYAFDEYRSRFSWAENARRTAAVYRSVL
ncbi:MAG TPA: glycosyltransferase family 4 protein [Planctomycetaceae bacterium]